MPRILLLFLFLIIQWPLTAFAQDVRVFYVARGTAVWQYSSSGVTRISSNTGTADWPDYAVHVGALLNSGSIADFAITVPWEMGSSEIPLQEEGNYWTEFPFSDLRSFSYSTGGTYTFTGTGSTVGSFTETVNLDNAFNGLGKKLLTNWTALQTFDPAQPVVLEITPLAAPDSGIDGFITVDVSYWDGQNTVDIWNSDSITGPDSFGLDPSTTSVTIPAGVLTGSPYQTYDILLTYNRGDTETALVNFPSAPLVILTGHEVFTQIHPDPDLVGGYRTVLQPGSWVVDDRIGYIYGLTEDWGYSYDFGYVNVAFSPNWYYQSNLGYLYVVGGTFDSGIWMYGPTAGWIYTSSALGGGWYADADENYDNMINPLN